MMVQQQRLLAVAAAAVALLLVVVAPVTVYALPPKQQGHLAEQREHHQAKNQQLNQAKPGNDGSHTIQCPGQDQVCHCMADNCSALTPPPLSRSPFCICPEAQACCHFQVQAAPKKKPADDDAELQDGEQEKMKDRLSTASTNAGGPTFGHSSFWTIGLGAVAVAFISFAITRRLLRGDWRRVATTEEDEMRDCNLDEVGSMDDAFGGGSDGGYRDDVDEDEDVKVEIEMTNSN